MKLIKNIEDTFKEYTYLCSKLTKQISNYFLERDISVCVSIVDETVVEILFKSHLEDKDEMLYRCEVFRQELKPFCDEFSLQIIHLEGGSYEQMELPPEYRTYRYERVLLVGVKDE